MTCRHDDGDPRCTTKNPQKMRERALGMMQKWVGIDVASSDYDVVHTEEHETYLIAEVEYPSCMTCNYEGRKLMVFANTTRGDALRWKQIDPHFRAPPDVPDPRQAPSPIARFPANLSGWVMARALVQVLLQKPEMFLDLT